MATTLQDMLNKLPPQQRKEVEERAAELIAGEYARREAQEIKRQSHIRKTQQANHPELNAQNKSSVNS